MRNWLGSLSIYKRVMFAALLLFLVLSLALVVDNWLGLPASEVTKIKDIIGSWQSIVTMAAIVIGGMLAYFKLQVFRDFEPHLTISHEVSHRQIGDSYVHIAVTSTLHNGSKVKLDFREAFIRLQQISPTSDGEVESLYTSTFVNHESIRIFHGLSSMKCRESGTSMS